MHRRMMKFPVILALALGLSLAACQGDGGIVEPTIAPEAAAPEAAPQAAVATDSNGETYTIIQGRPLLRWPLRVTDLISFRGGTISLLGHTLEVPRGAVTSPTLFTMLVSLNGYVEVHLSALLPRLFRLLDIGSHGFREPVRVTLSYANATNVEDPNDLVIVHVLGWWGYRRVEPVPTTVDTERQTVTAELDHFSRYAIASN